ncbi:MAG: DNA glycosylase [Verrucomicrobiota bacterium]
MPSTTEPFTLLKLSAPELDLRATLTCGQSFCWQEGADGWWRGWIGRRPAAVRPAGRDGLTVRAHGQTRAEVAEYFQLGLDLDTVVASFPATERDTALHAAVDACRGLRILRQDRWETLANFICSPQKQIVQIAQINALLRRRFGTATETDGGIAHAFPEPETLAAAGTPALLECKLGYRAKNLAASAERLATSALDLDAPAALPTPEAREYLKQFPGVGDKVADCVLLFAYNKWDAFPVDVWVERALRELYFRRKRKVTPKRLRDFSRTHFGPYGGYAQQVLFHWIRMRKRLTPSDG